MIESCFVSLPRCDHGNIKMSCYYCNIEGKIDAIETTIKELAIKSDDIDRLNQFTTYTKIIGKHTEHLHEMESDVTCLIQRMDDNDDAMQAFENSLNQLMATIMTENKKPHKCPRCDGTGIAPSIKVETCLFAFQDCPACESGIVWG